MIIADGHIEVLQTTGASVANGGNALTIDGKPVTATGLGGLDADGYPVAMLAAYGKPIACQVAPVKVDRLAKDEGERVKAEAYELYVALRDMPGDIRILRLTWHGRDLGKFSVTSIEPLTAVQQVKIQVSHAD